MRAVHVLAAWRGQQRQVYMPPAQVPWSGIRCVRRCFERCASRSVVYFMRSLQARRKCR